MIVEELKIENFQETIFKHIQNKQECVLYSLIPRNIVYKGKGTIDEQYCLEHGYLVYNSIDFGGGLVATKNDLVLVVLKNEGWSVGLEIVESIISYLKEKGLNVSLVNNDIIIDEQFKVASYSSVNVGNNCIYTGVQCTFNPNVEDIKNICKYKPMKKIPKGLSDYGITNEELLNLCLNICRK